MTTELPSDAAGSRAELGKADEGVCPHVSQEDTGVAGQSDRPDEPGSDAVSESWSREWVGWCLAGAAVIASVVSFLIYFHRGEILLFGDAVAHINIARRVFDSRYPGLLQLGTVWLPLPHLLMIPFVVVNSWWHSGAAASIPSMVAYVFSAVGVFRLVRGGMSAAGVSAMRAKLTACFAAAVYGLNPNLLYLQSTAMTESLYLALFVWALVFFSEFWSAARVDGRAEIDASMVWKCGLCLLGACLTRYDGWFVSGVISVIAVLMVARLASKRSPTLGTNLRPVLVFMALAWIGPIAWLAYNAVVYKNALEFANGPYSAKSIEKKAETPGYPPHPGSGNLVIAGAYFSKAGLFGVAEGNWQQGWLWLAVLGIVWSVWQKTKLAPLFLLWLPLPFYMLSVGYGGVPIYVPTWWPFSLYNIRYGVQLLPALAVFLAMGVSFLTSMMVTETGKRMIAVLTLGFVVVSYAGVWRAGPAAFREAWVNSLTRLQLEAQLAEQLKKLPPDSTLLMYLGEHVGALQDAGKPLRRAISEGSHRVWVQPSDPQGLWELALADPAAHADFVIAFEDDPVWQAVHDRNLHEVARIEVVGQKTAVIFRAR
jgi:hypothetical protein